MLHANTSIPDVYWRVPLNRQAHLEPQEPWNLRARLIAKTNRVIQHNFGELLIHVGCEITSTWDSLGQRGTKFARKCENEFSSDLMWLRRFVCCLDKSRKQKKYPLRFSRIAPHLFLTWLTEDLRGIYNSWSGYSPSFCHGIGREVLLSDRLDWTEANLKQWPIWKYNFGFAKKMRWYFRWNSKCGGGHRTNFQIWVTNNWIIT